MSFLFPATLFLGLLAAGIAALYLRKPKRRDLQVSTLLFWQKILERQPHRRFLGKLRNPFSLLLQLLIFALLLLALARPEWGRTPGGQSTVVVLDARARMQAGDGEAFRAAVNAAGNIVSQAGADNEVAVLATGGGSQIVSPFSADGKDLRERLAALNPSDAGGDLVQTQELARNLLKGRSEQKTRAVLISDRPPADGEGFEQILIGQPHDNVAILALAQRPMPASPQSAEIYARFGNFSPKDREIEVEFALDGKVFDLRKLSIPAGEEKDLITIVPEEMLRKGSGLLTARLTGADGLAVDNTAFATLSIGESLRALLVTKGNPFLEGALKADPGLKAEILDPDSWRNEMAGSFDAVIFDDWLPDGAKPEDFTKGNFFFFGRTPFDAVGEEKAAVGVETTDAQSPLLWNVDIHTIQPNKMREMRVPEGWRTGVALESAGEPLLMTLEKPGGPRIVAAAFRADSSRFPLRVGFPLFVSNALHWLAGRNADAAFGYSAGQTYLPSEGEKVSGEPQALPGSAATLTESPVFLRKNGFYEVREPGKEAPRWIAVNTASRDESDLRKTEANRNILFLSQSWTSLHPWQWLAFAALLLMLVEWLLHHRRVTE